MAHTHVNGKVEVQLSQMDRNLLERLAQALERGYPKVNVGQSVVPKQQ